MGGEAGIRQPLCSTSGSQDDASQVLNQVADVMAENHDMPCETLWKILKEFLKTQVQKIERYTPWELDEKEDKKTGKECYKCNSKNHETKNCPKHPT